MTRDQQNAFLQAHWNTHSVPELSKAMILSRKSIARRAAKLGLPRKVRVGRSGPRPRLTQAELQQLRDLWVYPATLKSIGAALGVKATTVYRARCRLGLPPLRQRTPRETSMNVSNVLLRLTLWATR